MTRHHRRPQSRGGKGKENNISMVLHFKHQAYHCLFDSLAVPDMLKKLIFYFELFGDNKPRTIEQQKHVQAWIHGQRERDRAGRIKKQLAWNSLFANLTVSQILDEINNVWIDPAYEIIVGNEGHDKITFTAHKAAIF